MAQRRKRPEEEVIWSDRKHFLWFPWTFEIYRIANGRIYCRTGLINQEENECMIYRVLDISLKRSLLNRICGTGTIIMRTRRRGCWAGKCSAPAAVAWTAPTATPLTRNKAGTVLPATQTREEVFR